MTEEVRKTPPRNVIPLIATRAPAQLWAYLSWIAKNPALQIKTMREFTTLNAPLFLESEPWRHGLKLRKALSIAHAPRMTGSGGGGVSDVLQVNVLFDEVTFPPGKTFPKGKTVSGAELRDLFKKAAEEINDKGIRAARTIKTKGVAREVSGKVTTSTLVWNYLYWLAVIKYPPGQPLSPIPRYQAFSPANSSAASPDAAPVSIGAQR